MHELETWWNDNIVRQSDQTIHALIQEEAQLKKESPPGLAQALQFESDADVSALELDARRRYIAAAEQSLQQHPVIVPEF